MTGPDEREERRSAVQAPAHADPLDSSLEARGQLFAFVLAMISLVGGIGLIVIGASVEALVSLLAAIAALGGVFIYREVQSRKGERGDWEK